MKENEPDTDKKSTLGSVEKPAPAPSGVLMSEDWYVAENIEHQRTIAALRAEVERLEQEKAAGQYEGDLLRAEVVEWKVAEVETRKVWKARADKAEAEVERLTEHAAGLVMEHDRDCRLIVAACAQRDALLKAMREIRDVADNKAGAYRDAFTACDEISRIAAAALKEHS